jgi:hypothetical protein
MPSRTVVGLIVAFWLSATGLAFYRDLWPRIAASGPPPLAIDLSDEATQYVPVHWTILRDSKDIWGERPIGTLQTKLAYRDADDTFEFISQYKDVRIEAGVLELVIPEATTRTQLTRSGSLREQSMTARMAIGELHVEASVEGRNENGMFVGRCAIDSPLVKFQHDLTPVPVKDGQALNPLQPVNRIVGIRPGQRWTVQEIDPLGEALAMVFKEKLASHGVRLPERERQPLLAEVGATPEPLAWGKTRETATCWVIDYRRGEAQARTWVRVLDSKVLRQEASLMGDRIALERDE